jgi:alkaline phosphatase D
MTLDDYRRRYARYRMDEDLQRLHARVPFTGVWDDHEVAGNWAGHTAKGGIPDDVFAVRRAAAFQAFWEAMPFDLAAPVPGGELRQYRALAWGGNARIIQLDTRQYRADQACGDRTTSLCDEALVPGREMLGPRQSKWLAAELAGRDRAWPLIAQGVPPCPLDHAPGEDVAVPMDKWVGYPHARAAFERQLAAAAPVITLAGDLHGHYAATRANPETGQAAGADFVTTSISSAGDGREHDVDWPVLKRENPELVYHSRRRGYLLIDADADRVEADFRIVDRITTKAHKLYSDARATVRPDGRLEVDDERRLLREL